MTRIVQTVHAVEHKMDAAALRFAHVHPFLYMLSTMFGMPVLILAAIFLCALLVLGPAALFGSL